MEVKVLKLLTSVSNITLITKNFYFIDNRMFWEKPIKLFKQNFKFVPVWNKHVYNINEFNDIWVKNKETQHSLEFFLKQNFLNNYVSSCLKTRASGHCYHISGQNNTAIREVFLFLIR